MKRTTTAMTTHCTLCLPPTHAAPLPAVLVMVSNHGLKCLALLPPQPSPSHPYRVLERSNIAAPTAPTRKPATPRLLVLPAAQSVVTSGLHGGARGNDEKTASKGRSKSGSTRNRSRVWPRNGSCGGSTPSVKCAELLLPPHREHHNLCPRHEHRRRRGEHGAQTSCPLPRVTVQYQ